MVLSLTDEEIAEFKESNVDKLLKKYKNAIINRTRMCREEHGFVVDYSTGDVINAITPIVKTIIDIIKISI